MQCDTLQEDKLSGHSVPSGDINPSDIPQENKVAVTWTCEWASLEGGSDAGSGFESDSTSPSDSESDSMPAADLPLESLAAMPMPAALSQTHLKEPDSNQPSKEEI